MPTEPAPGPVPRPEVEQTAGPRAASGWRRMAEVTYAVIAWLLVAATIVQFLLAGLGVFGAESFEAHKDFSGVFHLFALLLVVLALLVRRNRADLILTITLFVLVTVQFMLPEARDDAPGVAALHVVNALFIYTIAYHLAQRGTRLLRARAALAP